MELLAYETCILDSKQHLDEIATLRTSVWKSQVETEAFTNGVWLDEHDSHSIHFGIFNDEKKLIAAARLCLHDEISAFPDYEEIEHIPFSPESPIGMMTRLVVHPNYQRMGLSGKLDRARINKARELGAKMVVLQAPDYRKQTVENQGFNYLGEAIDLVFTDRPELKFYFFVKYF